MRRNFILIGGVLGLLVLSACSDGKTSKGSENLKADAVCDGAFQGDAARALEEVSGAKGFHEVESKYLSSTYDQTAKDLVKKENDYNSDLGKDFCEFRAAGEKSGTPAKINFSLVLVDVNKDVSSSVRQSTSDSTAFTFARDASATDDSAWISFSCTPESDNPLMRGTVTELLQMDPFNSGKPQTRRADNMRLAYSAAVKMANQFDCFKESKLPHSLGKLTARPIKKPKSS